MEHNRTESSKFAVAADELLTKLENGATALLDKSAARGFPMPPGSTLDAILQASQEVKTKLVEANGKIYDDRRKTIFEEQEFYLKLLVRIGKLAMDAYREEIFNAIALEQSRAQATKERVAADIEWQNSETESRQVAIIRAKAEMEAQIVVHKRRLVDVETANLDLERAVILAQLETAEKKLEIINSIYQVLAAEELVLAAERRRAASLALVLQAKEALAAIKQEMIPFHMAKADARSQLAAAVEMDAEVRKELERLGYDKLDLKIAEEYVDHQIREANEEYELAQEAKVRAETATTLARNESRRLLQEYSNKVRASILAKKLKLEEDGIDFKLESRLARVQMDVDDDAEVLANEQFNLTQELANLLQNLTDRAQSQADTIESSALQIHSDWTQAISSRKISEGIFAGGGM